MKKYSVEYYHQEPCGGIVPNSIHQGRTNLEPAAYLKKYMRGGRDAQETELGVWTIPSDTIKGGIWVYYFTENE